MSPAKIGDLGRAADAQALRLPARLRVIADAAGCTIRRAYAARLSRLRPDDAELARLAARLARP